MDNKFQFAIVALMLLALPAMAATLTVSDGARCGTSTSFAVTGMSGVDGAENHTAFRVSGTNLTIVSCSVGTLNATTGDVELTNAGAATCVVTLPWNLVASTAHTGYVYNVTDGTSATTDSFTSTYCYTYAVSDTPNTVIDFVGSIFAPLAAASTPLIWSIMAAVILTTLFAAVAVIGKFRAD
jgi:hypothetical protein